MSCEYCFHWTPILRGDKPLKKGKCKAVPPTPVLDAFWHKVVAIWPETKSDDECGMFKYVHQAPRRKPK